MNEEDTVKLLKESDAGVTMGLDALNDVLNYVKNDNLRDDLVECRNKHECLQKEIQELLEDYNEDGKSPNPVAKGMSWMKTNVKLAINESDETIADLITDGCNMGVKSLNRYLNEYDNADESAKVVAKKLVSMEADLAANIKYYL